MGGWGKNHARILSKLGVLSAVCDTNDERAKDFGKKYSVNHYGSINKLMDLEEFRQLKIKAIIIKNIYNCVLKKISHHNTKYLK